MAEETQAGAVKQSGDSTSMVMILGVVLICILAVFMVTSLNRMKMELIKLNTQMEMLVNTTAQNSMASFQAVDTDGNVQMLFTPKPMEAMMMPGDLMLDKSGPSN